LTLTHHTKALLKGLSKSSNKEGNKIEVVQYYNATHGQHVKPMFEIAWMPTLAGISGTLQTTEVWLYSPLIQILVMLLD
jgi:brefeldin A-inhibited guanine nucleotide-exchange protein